MNSPGDERTNASPSRYRVRLPGFVNDEEIGLGDVVSRVTSTLTLRQLSTPRRDAQPMDDIQWPTTLTLSSRRPTEIDRNPWEACHETHRTKRPVGSPSHRHRDAGSRTVSANPHWTFSFPPSWSALPHLRQHGRFGR